MTEEPFFWSEVRSAEAQQLGLKAAFVERVDGVEVGYDKWAVLDNLEPRHSEVVEGMGFDWKDVWRSEQVHGTEVALVPTLDHDFLEVAGELRDKVVVGVDALVTNLPGVVLGIYVADCGAIYFFDRKTGAVGLAHSGKKGTEGNILEAVLERMGREFGTKAEDVAIGLGPCIRPCHYDVDFAADIAEQAEACGVASYEDCGLCTGADLKRFYSYRMEEGKTGRMLALIGRAGF